MSEKNSTPEDSSDKQPTPKPEPDKPVSDNPFHPDNLDKLRLDQNFGEMAEVKPAITNVAVRKPNRHEFVRVRPGSEWRFETGCFVDKESREVYVVSAPLRPTMPGDVTSTCLVLTITRNSPIPIIWPLTIPDTERPNRWHESAIEASRLAEADWLRCVADMSAGQYVPYVAAANLPEPEWPDDLTMADYLELAFKDRFIKDTDHPVLRRLRGEI